MSKPLELKDYIVIATRSFNYTDAFYIPNRSPRNLALVEESDVEFTIWRYTVEFEEKIGERI
jgi:hypothetical protein